MALALDTYAQPEDWVQAIAAYADANEDLPVIFGYGFLASAFGKDGPDKSMIDAIAATKEKYPETDSRFTITHIQVLLDSDIQRFADLNVIAQSTPLWASYDVEGPGSPPGRPVLSRRRVSWHRCFWTEFVPDASPCAIPHPW